MNGPNVEKLKEEIDVEDLIKALEGGDGEVSCNAALALGKIADKRAVEPLIKALGDVYKEWRTIGVGAITVSMAAKQALGMIGEPAVGPLIKALEANDARISPGAANALGIIKDNRAVEPLVKALRSEYWRVKDNASDALQMIGEPAIEALTRALNDENKKVRKRVEKILKKIQKK